MEAGATAGGSSANVQSPPASAAATAAKSLLYHDYANDSKLSISLRRYKLKDQVVCPNCGQFHEPHGTHLYDYHQAVDEDLMCQICLQPLVNPLDTRCGHTFCSRCLHNYLKIQSQCPVDRQRLDDIDIQQSSILVRRLLDKLLVVCPNVDYCEEVLPRSELEAHLLHRCRGAVTRCIKSSLGCTFQGPRSALQSHLWECPYRDQDGGRYKLSSPLNHSTTPPHALHYTKYSSAPTQPLHPKQPLRNLIILLLPTDTHNHSTTQLLNPTQHHFSITPL
ncbi:Ligand of Numb protein X 2 [Mizuhopecten yessoensis]|uniref:Ligand of Numb protein X 2 n=1 Tax=Mizuhopecten yessoensis TaxID=6573 RepID=A0A210Q389_MIZYE|nr:Ligand of Numb protein X 2 [Mizuhopecten yessoensis]